jgi:CRP-like cAMP-binding protein
VLEGGVRQYKIIEGNEITTNFYTEEQWIIFLESFENPVVSSDYLVCFEDTTLVVGDEQAAQKIFKKFPRFETLSRKVVENAFLEQQQIMTTYITNTPEQRYLKLMQERPDLFQKVPQYQIASYIGVKPESLSRIRKKMAQK